MWRSQHAKILARYTDWGCCFDDGTPGSKQTAAIQRPTASYSRRPSAGHPLNFSNGAGPPTIPHRQLPAVTGFCFCPDRRHLLISSPFPKERHSSIPSILWLRLAACIPIPSFASVPPLSRHVVKNNLEMSVCFVDPCTAISLRFASGAGVQNNAGVLMRPASNL